MKKLLEEYHKAMTGVMYYSRLWETIKSQTVEDSLYINEKIKYWEHRLAEADIAIKKFKENAKNTHK